MNAGIVLLNGVVLEVSKAGDWLYAFRSNGCASFECMLRCPLWFRMVDGCFSLVLWEGCICSCWYLSMMFLDLTIVDGCHARMRSTLTYVFDGPEDELCEKAVVVTEGDTLEWFGVKVLVVRDTWDADVLALAVEMLLKKSSEGLEVGLILCKP